MRKRTKEELLTALADAQICFKELKAATKRVMLEESKAWDELIDLSIEEANLRSLVDFCNTGTFLPPLCDY